MRRGGDVTEGEGGPRRFPHEGGTVSLLASFRYALAGMGHVLRTQRNARIQVGVAAMALGMGWALGLSSVEWAVLLLTIALVLAAEMANTVLEVMVDIACPEYHPLAKTAKDVSAGAVLLTAMASVAVGLALFGPRLWAMVWR